MEVYTNNILELRIVFSVILTFIQVEPERRQHIVNAVQQAGVVKFISLHKIKIWVWTWNLKGYAKQTQADNEKTNGG